MNPWSLKATGPISHAVPVEVQAAESLEAAWDMGPVAFNDQGFIGLR